MFLEIASYLGGSRSHQVYGKMKDFPSCFGESGVQVADSAPSTANRAAAAAQNLATCVYHYQSQLFSGFITVTWIKNLMAQGLSIGIENTIKESLAKVDIKPWLFSRRKGIKSIVLDSTSIDIYWDLSSAKFGSGPEPLEGFYLAIAINQELSLLLGDMLSEAYRRIDPAPFASKATLVARKEHIFGKRSYASKAQFCGAGRLRDIRIEYDPYERLTISIDRKEALQVTNLKWKFRGNQSIVVDGVSVEVYWDVHGWLFGGGAAGNAIFLFRSQGDGEKPWVDREPAPEPAAVRWKGWERCRDASLEGRGFSLVLCAWKNE